jgi:hypothetical protein
MAITGYITTSDLCTYHHIEYAFITSLQEAGLVEINVIEEQPCIPEAELPKVEKMIRLHHDLDINIEGIEAITHLLQRLEGIQQEMRTLRNKLRRYEQEY